MILRLNVEWKRSENIKKLEVSSAESQTTPEYAL